MAKSKKPRVPIAERRGVFEDGGNSWSMTLLQIPGRTGPVDLDEVLDHLIERGVVGAVRRTIAADIFAKQVPTPAGPWGLLVALPGQSWAYLLPSVRNSYDLAATIAEKTGLRTIGAGYQDTANATAFDCFEGESALVRFESCGMGGEIVEEYDGDLESVLEQTRFTGTRLPADWINQFEHEGQVLEALAREFDAYIPYLGVSGLEDVVKIYGYDRKEFRPDSYLRIDLLGFGHTRLEPSLADRHLRDAINEGDIKGVRTAVAAGADLHRVPVYEVSPLHLALGRCNDPKAQRDLVVALLELGADVNEPDQEPLVHVVLDHTFADQAQLIDLLELLTSRGADVNARGINLLTRTGSPLHVAARKGWLAVAKFLLAKGADIHAADALGKTPRQTAEDAARSLQENGFDDPQTNGSHAAMIALLADAERGGADLDWHADAEEASRRELRRRRKMKVAFGRIGEGFKTLGGLMDEDPSAQALVDAVVYAQPDAIHLTPSAADWASETLRAQIAATLAAEGFHRVGRFDIPEMPNVRIEGYHHPGEHLFAAIYDAAGESFLDLVRYGQDGTKLTITNNTTPPETHFEMPDKRTIHLPGAPVAALFRTLRAEPEPPAGIASVAADEFVSRVEHDYRREIKARKRAGRHKT